MEEGIERNEGLEKPKKYDVFSKVVRAGQRTYFFDVKATHGNNLYIAITESKKIMNQEGHQFYEKHKIFLYPEDFEYFSQGLSQTMGYIRNAKPRTIKLRKQNNVEPSQEIETKSPFNEFEEQEQVVESFINADVNFEDLGKK
jgi:hypothetical protein